ncbi:c-type cytochrome [Pedobacter sp. PAMC26386]|nr:c-type cytochrome [Pedobacter sp. PAMC26386]
MPENNLNETEKKLIHTARSILLISVLLVVCCIILLSTFLWNDQQKNELTLQMDQTAIEKNGSVVPAAKNAADQGWQAPDESTIPTGEAGEKIRYGKELIVNTAKYFGPNGSIAVISNGMNCQNCHLQAGTKMFANNYAVFFTSYPKKSNRSGQVVPASNRIAECFERSLAGKAPDASGKEVQAMLTYLKWVGSEVKKGEKVFGTAFERIKYMDRPADPQRGKILYAAKCVSCHGKHGEGVLSVDRKTYTYPPLWGDHSYNDAAGMYRLINFAGFVKNNMPLGATYKDPQLSDEESWDLAAFVNSQPRRHKDQKEDYPDLTKKPVDAPYGPYSDQFTEIQHKYGPFKPIAEIINSINNK